MKSVLLVPLSVFVAPVQFLPQDKVSSFARLKPTELLRETEKSIGEGELLTLHEELIALKRTLNDETMVSALPLHVIISHPQLTPSPATFCQKSTWLVGIRV